MSKYLSDFVNTLKPLQEAFDVFYCKDESIAKEYFNIKELPDVYPYVTIIDPIRRTPLKEIKNRDDPIPVKKDRPLSDGSYIYKTRSII